MKLYFWIILALIIIPSAFFGISTTSFLLKLSDTPTTNLNIPKDLIRIPKIIHHVWNSTTDIPEKWRETTSSCASLHRDYQIKIWTDQEAEQLVKTRFPHIYDSYMSYPYLIQKVDAIRYMILYEYGGFYLDLDIGCKRRLDPLRFAKVLLPQTEPIGFSNDFMASEPKHPFFKLLIDNLPAYNHYYGTKYITVMFSTGPNFVNMIFSKFPKTSDIAVLLMEFYGGASPRRFFYHVEGSSWHGDDVKFVGFLVNHSVGVVGGFILFVGFFFLVKALLKGRSWSNNKRETAAFV